MVSAEHCFKPAPAVAYRTIGGRVVIVDPGQNKMISLNQTGSVIWEALDGRSAQSVATDIAATFDVTDEEALADVQTFITELAGKGLVVRVKDPA
ncbi:MAG: PqqD family protein [Myxococcota bacterium]|nr:PqqD family protein [Myxococcota bacterium]